MISPPDSTLSRPIPMLSRAPIRRKFASRPMKSHGLSHGFPPKAQDKEKTPAHGPGFLGSNEK